MAKSELKTKQTEASVGEFLENLSDPQQAEDSRSIITMMEQLSGDNAKMWGPAIIGFGHTVLKYDSGRELDWMKIGFSPRKAAIALYLLGCVTEGSEQLQKLGKYKTGKGCLYVKRLSDVNTKVLRQLIDASLKRAADKGLIN